MDIISHGLWGGVASPRRGRLSYWLAFLFGIFPDLFSFGIFTLLILFGFVGAIDWRNGPPSPDSIPQFVYQLYNFSHSLVIFSLVFLIVWFFRKKPFYEMIAWGLHILMDIGTHSYAFFPTPFLLPISDFKVDGIPWSDPRIMIPNIVVLVFIYTWFYLSKNKKSRMAG